MDESFYHTHHAPKSGWYLCKFVKGQGLNKRRKMVEKRNEIVRGAKGKRLVIVHAMTRAGDIEGEPMIGCDNADCNQWWHKCCLGFGDKEDAWMELTSNAFYLLHT